MIRKYHDIQQNTEEWFNLRIGKITASNFSSIMAYLGKPFGETAKKYAMKIILEEMLNKKLDSYSNANMERGIELEPEARKLYEMETFSDVQNGGFLEYGKFGGSADGIVGKGIIEIKSVLYTTHFLRLIEGGYDSGYTAQIQGNIWLYEKDWCDFISYCPDFPINKQLYIFRVMRDDEYIKNLEHRLNEFTALINDYKEKLK